MILDCKIWSVLAGGRWTPLRSVLKPPTVATQGGWLRFEATLKPPWVATGVATGTDFSVFYDMIFQHRGRVCSKWPIFNVEIAPLQRQNARKFDDLLLFCELMYTGVIPGVVPGLIFPFSRCESAQITRNHSIPERLRPGLGPTDPWSFC